MNKDDKNVFECAVFDILSTMLLHCSFLGHTGMTCGHIEMLLGMAGFGG